MPSIYKMTHSEDVEEILEELRTKLSKEFGVTINGNRCTVRWTQGGHLVDVQMIIENVGTVEEMEEKRQRYDSLFKKYPHLKEELYYAKEGKHTK